MKMEIIDIPAGMIGMMAECMSALKPPPEMTLSQWADKFRMLSAENSAEPGRWHTDKAPYQREIMDAIGDPHTRKVVVMSAAQIGKTAMLMNMLGYFMHYAPAPILVMQPTLEMGQTFSKDFLAPMLRDTPVLRNLVDTKSRYAGNTILKKNFPGGHVTIIGANSPASLASRPIKVLLADEVDRYPASAGTEGDPLLLGQKRQTTFWDKKTVVVSTPGNKGVSRIAEEFEESTQEEWNVPCPRCGYHQPLVWANLLFDKTAPGLRIRYRCGKCEGESSEHQWKAMGKYGKFVLFYLAAMALSLVFPLLPVSGWPFLVVFVILSLFSNSISGLVAGSVCLMLPVILQNTGSSREFMLYFFSGLVGILVFSRLNEDFRVGLPVFISLICLTVCLSANIILFERERLSISQFTFVAINIMVNFILLMITLKIFNGSVIHRYRDRYMDLNDPEFPLLVQLKEYNKSEYYRAIHTAYLGDRIAKRLGINDVVVKACGYYHRIGILKGENTWDNVKLICEEYRIPEDTRKVLKEYLTRPDKVIAKETTVLMFADCIVRTILDEFSKDSKAELNYKQIIDTVFNKKMESGALSESDISIAQMREMRKLFKAEQLYYDFLR